MNFKWKILLAFAIPALAAMFAACDRKTQVLPDDEEAVYALVGDANACGDYETALLRADSILQAPLAMSDSLRAYIMIERDIALGESGRTDRALAYADTLIEFGKKHGVGLAVMQGLQNKGILTRRKGDWNRAISLYKEGMETAVGEDDMEMQQVFAEMLSVACTEHGLYDEALSFCRRSVDMAREMCDTVQEINAISTMGAILARKGDHKAAVEVLRPYRIPAMRQRGVVRVKYLTPFVKSYIALDSLQRVRETVADIYDAIEGLPMRTQAYLVVVNAEAMLAAKEGRYRDQWRWLQTADSIGNMGSAADHVYAERAECLANMGRTREAYEMQCKATAAVDSLRTADNDRRLSELMVEYESLRKDNEIMRLGAERMRWILISIVCAVLVAVAVVGGVARLRRLRRRQERERREEYLRGLETERRRMARELHDDIAGSLVGLQWKMRADSPEEVERSLRNIARRVRSLSHEMMPVEFRDSDFVAMLADYVASLNASADGWKIIFADGASFPWGSLPSETTHELYRMVQEAVRNAITHGCGGDIMVRLEGDCSYIITVSNPCGCCAVPESGSGAGLSSLSARAALVGASLEINADNGFFTVRISGQSASPIQPSNP